MVRNKFWEFKEALRRNESVKDMLPAANEVRGWMPPHEGCIKINSDAAIKGEYSFLSLVARDECGRGIEARVFKFGTSDPSVAEFMAIQKVILLSLPNGWKNVNRMPKLLYKV